MKLPLLSLLTIAALSTSAFADTPLKNISTGFDETSNLQLPDGAVDTDWAIVVGGNAGHIGQPLTAVATPVDLPSPWIPDADSAASRWLTLQTQTGTWGNDIEPGTYLFQTIVNVAPAVNASTVAITNLRYAADDRLLNISVNGVTAFNGIGGPNTQYEPWISLGTVGGGLFQTGANQITFLVENGTSDPVNPMGLRLEAIVAADASAPIPEPTTAGLIALSTVALLARFRRKAV